MARPHSLTPTSTTSSRPSSQQSAHPGPSGRHTTSSTDRRLGESIRIVSVTLWAGPPCRTVKRSCRGAGASTGAKAERELGYVARVSYEEAMSEIERDLAQRGMIKR